MISINRTTILNGETTETTEMIGHVAMVQESTKILAHARLIGNSAEAIRDFKKEIKNITGLSLPG